MDDRCWTERVCLFLPSGKKKERRRKLSEQRDGHLFDEVFVGFFPALGASFGIGGAWLGLLSLVSQNSGKGFFQLVSEDLSSFLFVVLAAMPLTGIIWMVGSAKLAIGRKSKDADASSSDV